MEESDKGQEKSSLNEKDCQLFSKAYRTACELYYQNSSQSSYIEALTFLTEIIPQIVENRAQANAMAIVSLMEILKAKAKNEVNLKQKIDKAVEHLRRPIREKLNPLLVVELLKNNELFSTGCIIAIRLFPEFGKSNEANSKPIFESIGNNFLVNPTLGVELLELLCSINQQNCRLTVREGIVRTLCTNYIPQVLKDRLSLYKCIKLIKKIGSVEKTILWERERVLANIIYAYDDYIPIVSDICTKCYDTQYAHRIEFKYADRQGEASQIYLWDYPQHTYLKFKFTSQGINQIYLWSYTQAFCKEILSKVFIDEIFESIRKSKQANEVEAKIYAIIGNYCKYCEYINNDFLKTIPKNVESLLNYLKMCISMVELNHNLIQLIDWGALDKTMQSNLNGNVARLHSILKEMIGRNVQVGTLSNSLKSAFSFECHADLLNQRLNRIPKNNAELEDTRHILTKNLYKGATQFDRDTLQMMKERGLDSLHTAITLGHKLNINPLINQWQMNSVQLLSKFLQIVELNLMMNEDAATNININKILEMIRWMEENYNGEIVDWGGVLQILLMLFEPGQWLKYIKQLPKDCFWLLQIEELTVKTQKTLLSAIDEVSKTANIKKLAIMIGFLGKSLQNEQKIKIIKNQKGLFEKIKNEIASNNNYKLNLMMLSYFLKGWYLEQSEPNYQANNKEFQQIISPFVDLVVSNYRALTQEHYFLQSCLPFKIHPHSLTKNIEQLINTHGRLSSYLYQKNPKTKNTIPANRFNAISHLPPRPLLENLKFLAKNPEMVNSLELERLLKKVSQNKDPFWNLYPHYINIMSHLIQLIEKSSQKSHRTDNIINVIQEIERNPDIQKEQREDLLFEMKDTLQGLQKRGAYIEIERIRTTVTKIVEEEVKQQIIYILNNYQIKEEMPVKVAQKKKDVSPAIPVKTHQSINAKKQVINVNNQVKKKENEKPPKEEQLILEANLENFAHNEILSKPIEQPSQKKLESIQDQFQSVRYQSVKKNHYDALEMLNRIVQKKQPTAKFNQIYPILSSSAFNEVEKQLHGSLLAKFYPMELQQRALTLLLDKQRTSLGKDLFEELVRKYTHAFRLVRRWKFESREALDISMIRVKEGYLNDACIVSTYNLTKTSEVEYFYARRYHLIIIQILCKVVSQDQVANYLTLVGIVGKMPQIKQQFISSKMHMKIMPLNTLFPMSIKVNSALCYALSTLSFEQPNVCTQIVSQKQELATIYGCMKAEPTNKLINEPGVCLIANLSYSSNQLKQILRQRKTIQLLLLIFKQNLVTPESSIYKQLLRSIGNLSMNKLCTEEVLDNHFCKLAVQLAENLDFFAFYDDKKARVMKLLINLISNLASHKTKLEIMHRQKITLLIVTMLETTEKNSQLLASCIDTVDALCQSNEIQHYMISEKKIMLILMDILKLQQQVAILLKTGRLVSNLSIHNLCVPYILKSNILSVMGNVVVPNLYIGCMSEEESKRMEGYVLKILIRIYQFKPELQLVLKSGYLDCLVRTIELIEVEEGHLEILFFYSSHLPNFLNKRAFSCLIRTLTKKIDSKVMLQKCIVSFKNLLTFSYNREDEDEVIQNIPQMYEKIMRSEYLVDGLFLLVYHLLRSHSLRKSLMKREDKVIEMIQNLGKQEIYQQISRTILFLIYNPITPLWIDICTHQQNEEYFNVLKKGFKCRLYRSDGSSKQAKISIDDEYNIRVFKYPDGQIKKKYVLNLNHIRDLQIDFRDKNDLWNHTVFSMQKSILQSHVPDKKLCVTLVGSSRWGEVKLINFEFSSQEQKLLFYQCLSSLIFLFKA